MPGTRRFLALFLLLAVAPLLHAQSEPDLFARAAAEDNAGDAAHAWETYSLFISRYPDSPLAPQARFREAVCLVELGRYAEGLAGLKDSAGGAGPDLPFWEGVALYHLGQYPASVARLKAFLAGAAPGPGFAPQALLYESLALEGQHNAAEALPILRQLVKDNSSSPVFPAAAASLARLLLDQKAFGDVESLVAGIDLSRLPPDLRDQLRLDDAEALLARGSRPAAAAIYRELTAGAAPVARVAYQRLFSQAAGEVSAQELARLGDAAAARFASDPAVMADFSLRLGAQWAQRGDLPRAELALESAWSLRNAGPRAWQEPLLLAEVLRADKQQARARDVLQQAVRERGSGSDEAYMLLGGLSAESGDLTQAEAWYTRLLASSPGSSLRAEARYRLAAVEAHGGEKEKALALVTEQLADPESAAWRQELLTLDAALLAEAGRDKEAAAALSELLAKSPDDLEARTDLIRELYQLKDYAGTIAQATALLDSLPDPASRSPSAFVTAFYLRGLSHVARKEYSDAASDLQAVTPARAEEAGLSGIVPSDLYWLGWSEVKTNAYQKAAEALDLLTSAYPTHPLAQKALFLDGWARFSLRQYELAAAYFSAAARGRDKTVAERSYSLYAKSLLNARKLVDAAEAIQVMIGSTPPSPYADSALLDYAHVLSQWGSHDEALRAYQLLSTRFPDSPLAAEADYRLAEIPYNDGQYAKASAAFKSYREKHPAGTLFDAALYWGGEASLSAGDPENAELLWDELVTDFPQSPFRANALAKVAAYAEKAGNLQRALDLYSELAAKYPDTAREARADIAVDRLRYELHGYGESEAALLARIQASTGQNRLAAMLELATIYIQSGTDKAVKGYQMLAEVTAQGSAPLAAQAQDMAGEYFYRTGDLLQAAQRFLAAAAVRGAGEDIAASSLFRATEMMTIARRRADAKAVAEKLAALYPSSSWSARARSLTEGGG